MKKILVILAVVAMFVSCSNVSGDKNTTEVDSTSTVDTTSITVDSLRVDTLVIE